MGNLLKVMILAVIQGIAEFLPVSSSGHLVLAKHFMGLESTSGATLEIVLHTGTLVSILVFYWRYLLELMQGAVRREREALRYIGLLLLGCLPAVVVAFTARDQLEEAFSHPEFVCFTLVATGVLLITTHFVGDGIKQVRWKSAVLIGLAQAVAMLPGVSRSGSTIGIARLLRIEPKKSAEFSFLMSAPLLAGASLLTILDLVQGKAESCGSSLTELVVGFLLSAIIGYFSLKYLLSLLCRGRFWLFGIYCCVVGLTSMVALWM